MTSLGLLLDVDGPIASPVTRTIAIPQIARDLAAIANAGNPVVFNTGRSDAFVREVVLPALRGAGLRADAPVFAVCEKGAVWLSLAGEGEPEVHVDEELVVPREFAEELHGIADDFADTMFWDATKRTMLSIEQRVEVPSGRYLAAQRDFDARAEEALRRHGLQGRVRLDPTIISTDVEDVRVGKALGAERALALVAEAGARIPEHWATAGDSRGDYAMADWLHAHGYRVEHLDVRPADGVPETPYPVLAHDELVHDEATAVFLADWRAAVAA